MSHSIYKITLVINYINSNTGVTGKENQKYN